MKERKEVENLIQSKKSELTKLEEITSGYARDIYTARLVLAYLMSPDAMSDYDFDRIVELMIGIRQVRLGIGPKKVVDAKGNVICECQIPLPYGPVKDYSSGMDEARERLALCLIPLVNDKFVPRFEFEIAKINQSIVDLNKQLLDMVSGHVDKADTSKDPQST